MPKYLEEQLKYQDKSELENLTGMDMIKRNMQIKSQGLVAKSHNVDKKSGTTKNSTKKKLVLPPLPKSRSPPPRRPEG
jgi:hypothetical protein